MEGRFGQGSGGTFIWTGSVIASGTANNVPPSAGMAGYNNYGTLLRSSTTANGGYRYATVSYANDYFGVISHKFRSQFMWRTDFTGRLVRTGFLDTTNQIDCVDGAYFEINGATCSAKTANNNTRTTHGTTITLALDTPYTFDVEVNAAGTEARFRVYSGTNETPIMDVTINTNIPTTSARAFGSGLVATESSTTTSDIGIVYSMGQGTIEGFNRSRG
jgi:hypothetical protein